MKRFFVLLLLAVAPAYSQEQPTVTIYDPVVQQTYTLQQTPTTNLQNINQTGGTALTLYDDGTTYTPIELPFDFYYFGNLYDSVYVSQNGFISFTSNANGCCNGEVLPFLSDNPYWNMNNSIFGMWSDLADFNTPGNPYYQAFTDRFTVGWYGVDELGTANKFTYEITLFDNSNFSIAYGDFDYFGPTGRLFTSGFQGDTSNEFWQLYNGNDPTILENKTYLFVSNEITPPPPPPEEPPPVIAPDCTINPNDPTCIINALIPDTTDNNFLADTGFDNGSDDGSELASEKDPVQDEMLAETNSMPEESFNDNLVNEQSLEEMLADNSSEENVEEELVAAIEPVAKELADEQKAETLADSIGKDVLEAALSIAADATASGSIGGSESQSSSSSSSSSRSTNEMVASEAAISESQVASVTEQLENQMMESQQDSALDILETGRAMGQEALAATMSLTESSASESLAEAESVAAASLAETESSQQSAAIDFSSSTMVAETATIETAEDIQQGGSFNQSEQIQEEVSATIVADTQQIEIQTQEEQTSFDQTTEVIVAQVEQTQQEENQVAQTDFISSVEYTDMATETENFLANIMDPQSFTEQEDLEMSILQQSIALSQPAEEENNRPGFAEAEAMTIANDPALANAFNVQPNTASLEFLGVLGSRNEEKSDAERRAEQVVAANKEQQDAINANYMDADQSGIVAAIAVDADVSSYLSARLMDNNAWYKPEDIYTNIKINDNRRGAYFLEKGNTDTYKKMVDEQYK